MGSALSSAHASNDPQAETWQNQQEGNAMLDGRGAYPRKVRGNNQRMFRNVDVAEKCQSALTAAYGDERSVHKAIAADTGFSPKAAENWTSGENPMSLTAFLNAYHNNEQFRAWARKIMLLEEDRNPEFEAELARFVRAAQNIRQRE